MADSWGPSDLGASLGESDKVGVGGLSLEEGVLSSSSLRMGESCSDPRGPDPEWPLIMPCAARKPLILSRISETFRLSCKGCKLKTREKKKHKTYAKPFGTLCAKAETLETETDTCLAVSVLVLVLVTFLGTR
jgi:hypothetical protein